MGRSVEQKLPVARCDKDGCRRWVVRMELGNPDFQPDQDVWAARWNRYNVTVNMRLNDLEKETLDKWSPSVRSGWYIGWCKRHGPRGVQMVDMYKALDEQWEVVVATDPPRI